MGAAGGRRPGARILQVVGDLDRGGVETWASTEISMAYGSTPTGAER